MTLQDLEKEIDALKLRNKQVETDKAWEISQTRKFLLMFLTYLTTGLYLDAISVDKPWINAIGASVGFLLSTLTLPFFKQLWEKHCRRTQ